MKNEYTKNDHEKEKEYLHFDKVDMILIAIVDILLIAFVALSISKLFPLFISYF